MDGSNANKAQGWIDFMRTHVPAAPIDEPHWVSQLPHNVEARRQAVLEQARQAAPETADVAALQQDQEQRPTRQEIDAFHDLLMASFPREMLSPPRRPAPESI